MHQSFRTALLLLGGLGLLGAPGPASATIEWIPIGNPGNAGDPQPQGTFGSVDYEYSISKFETTNAEYVLFLNAKAAADPLGLYDTRMDTAAHGGITRMGTPGSYSYVAKAGLENEPVTYITFFDALRFANWIHNGEGNGDTESGAYTLLGGTETPSNGSTVLRNPDAEVVLPTQDEWFKAAYYDPFLSIYYDFPTGTDETPTCTSPKDTPNTANCGDSPIRGLTDVGAYTGSPSPYGTFDQGGNASEWDEDIVFGGGRAVRGGSWTGFATGLKASGVGSVTPTTAGEASGFRLVLLVVPEPGAGALGVAALSALAFVGRRPSGS